MTQAAKHYAVKRVSLEGVMEGYDSSCFALVKPANFSVRLEEESLQSPDSTTAARVAFQEKLIKDHFISGSIKCYDGTNYADIELTSDIAIEIPDVSNKLAMFVLGYDVDPKDIERALMKPKEPMSDSKAIETISSEGSQASQTSSS